MENEKNESDITTLLRQMREGADETRRAAADQLFRLVHDRLHALAEQHLKREGRVNPILQPTLLVTDVFQRLVGGANIGPTDRKTFFGFARRVIPQILVDYFREFRAREGKATHITLDGSVEVSDSRLIPDVEVLHEALCELEKLDELQHQIVIDRFFLGRTSQEIADELEKPLIWVRRKWELARVWLHRRLLSEVSQ